MAISDSVRHRSHPQLKPPRPEVVADALGGEVEPGRRLTLGRWYAIDDERLARRDVLAGRTERGARRDDRVVDRAELASLRRRRSERHVEREGERVRAGSQRAHLETQRPGLDDLIRACARQTRDGARSQTMAPGLRGSNECDGEGDVVRMLRQVELDRAAQQCVALADLGAPVNGWAVEEEQARHGHA